MTTSFDLEMTVGEALQRGIVQRVYPKVLCGSRSPESGVPCRLDPGHEFVHHGEDGPFSSVAWAIAEPADDRRA